MRQNLPILAQRLQSVSLRGTALTLLLAAGAALSLSPTSAETARLVPAPLAEAKSEAASEVAVFAGGCFWGVQGVFQHVKGVTNAVSGYAGGDKDSAKYKAVGTGRTGHAEAVQVTFDPKVVSYGKLLQIYFSVAHDPTQLNRQGPDAGTQYRSTVFAMSPEQSQVAKDYIAQLDAAKAFRSKIATTIEQGKPFYAAEDYHQDYMTLNPTYPYIAVNDLPKVDDLARLFPDAYRADPVLVSEARASN